MKILRWWQFWKMVIMIIMTQKYTNRMQNFTKKKIRDDREKDEDMMMMMMMGKGGRWTKKYEWQVEEVEFAI